MSLEGSTLRPDDGANRNLYGRNLTAREIVREQEVQAPVAAMDLLTELQNASPTLKS